MKIFNFVAIGTAGLLATVVVAAQGQTNTTAPSKAEAIVDVNGNLHVPDSYRATYQFLGNWAVAANQGAGSKELHVVYASPGTITAYRQNGRFTDGALIVKEVFDTATGPMTTGTVSRADAGNKSASVRLDLRRRIPTAKAIAWALASARTTHPSERGVRR